MASPQTTRQVYIIGNKYSTQQCLSHLTGKTEELSGIWTVFADQVIGKVDALKGEVLMAKLKEQDMDCDDSLDLTVSNKRNHETTSGSSPNMKRLKSLDGSHINSSFTNSNPTADCGYESDTTESEEREVLADINVIITEDETGLNVRLASSMFQLFSWPALIVLAIDSEHFALEMYAGFIKELGILASKEEKSSKLLVVGMPRRYPEVNDQTMQLAQHRDELHARIFDSYFSSNIDCCEINQLRCKVQSLLHGIESRCFKGSIGRKYVDSKFVTGKCFAEKKTFDNDEISTLLDKKLLFCYKSGNKDYVYRPQVINEFQRALTEISNRMPAVRFSLSHSDFIRLIDNLSDRKSVLDAYTDAGLIYTESGSSNKTVYLLPLICPENLPVFDGMGYDVETNVLRLTVQLDIIPAFVKSNIVKVLMDDDWSIQSCVPNACEGKYSYFFAKQSHGLLVQFDSSKETTASICLCGLRTTTSCTERIPGSEYEKLTECIKCELRKLKNGHTADDSFICHHVKLKGNQYIGDVLKTDEENWVEVDLKKIDQLPAESVDDLLSYWFFSKIKEIETELNRKMSDAFMSDISGLFGHGTKLFFVSEGLPSESLSQIEIDNPKSTKDATFKMLVAWRKLKGLKANIAALRSAIQKSSHVNVNINDFDDMVKNHFGKS